MKKKEDKPKSLFAKAEVCLFVKLIKKIVPHVFAKYLSQNYSFVFQKTNNFDYNGAFNGNITLNGEATLFLKYRETLSYALPPIFCMLIKSFHFVGNFRDFPN